MKKRNLGMLAAAMLGAGLVGFGQTAQSMATKSANEIQATDARNNRRQRLPFVSPVGGGQSLRFRSIWPYTQRIRDCFWKRKIQDEKE